MVGDWMGSIYGVGGQRADWHLFLDHDGRYERTIRAEPDYERRDTGQWEHDEAGNILRLVSDTPDEADRLSARYWVLSVSTCEESNVLLVLAQGGTRQPESADPSIPRSPGRARLRDRLEAAARRTQRCT